MSVVVVGVVVVVANETALLASSPPPSCLWRACKLSCRNVFDARLAQKSCIDLSIHGILKLQFLVIKGIDNLFYE